MKKLNYKQQKLVEDNHNLIYSFMNKKNLDFNAIEDWYGVCALGMCKAALIFDSNKNIAFSTLAYVCMNNEIKNEFGKQKITMSNTLSIDCALGENIVLQDCIRSNYDEIKEWEFYETLNKHYNKLTDIQKNIVNDYIYTDLTQKDLGKKYGLSQAQISRICNGFFNNIYSDVYGKRGQKAIREQCKDIQGYEGVKTKTCHGYKWKYHEGGDISE